MAFSLLLETSTEKGCVAILEKDRMLYQISLPPKLNNSQYLLPAIEEGLKILGIQCRQLSYISVGVGPGSYTGIRVAAMVAKTLAYALQIPLVAFSSLKGFIPLQEGVFSAVIDAKIGGVYLLIGNFCNGKIVYQGEPKACALPDACNLFVSEKVSSIISPHAFALRGKLQVFAPLETWDWNEQAPNIQHLADLSWRKFLLGELEDVNSIELLYLRKTQAEIEKEKKNENLC